MFMQQNFTTKPPLSHYHFSIFKKLIPQKQQVLGVGGGGGNAVNRMIQTAIEGVSFWAINTDSQALDKSLAPNRLNIGRQITRGLGAGGIPSVGAQAAMENMNDMRHICTGADMVFITAGMGGGTGSGAAPVLAETARECGCLTVGVVTKPFAFEGRKRMKQAEEAIEELRKHVDTLIVVSNDKLLRIVPDNTPVTDAFLVADDILRQGVVGISEIIIKTGLVNVDFADVRAVMKDAGTALMGVGTGEGKSRAADAAVAAISSPLLDFPISEAKRIVFNVVGGPGLGLSEINAASEVIYENAHEDANIIFGALIDEKMGDEVSITVLACDFRAPDEKVLAGGMGGTTERSTAVTSNNDMRDPNFYKNRRQATKSPLGPDASVEETQKAITRGFKRPTGSVEAQEESKTKKRGFLRGMLRKLTGRGNQ
jgi:cell division protein FtsZ